MNSKRKETETYEEYRNRLKLEEMIYRHSRLGKLIYQSTQNFGQNEVGISARRVRVKTERGDWAKWSSEEDSSLNYDIWDPRACRTKKTFYVM